MPFYSYRCRDHSEEKKEVFVRTFSERLESPRCPVCEKDMKRLYEPANIIYHGGGFTKGSGI